MQNAPFKGALESFLVAVLPFLVDDPECAVLIWWSSMYPVETYHFNIRTFYTHTSKQSTSCQLMSKCEVIAAASFLPQVEWALLSQTHTSVGCFKNVQLQCVLCATSPTHPTVCRVQQCRPNRKHASRDNQTGRQEGYIADTQTGRRCCAQDLSALKPDLKTAWSQPACVLHDSTSKNKETYQ